MQGTQLISRSEWQGTKTGLSELPMRVETRPGEEGQRVWEELNEVRSFCARNLTSYSYANIIGGKLEDNWD